MIIAEDLLLLTFDDASGAADPWVGNLDFRLAGALLVELALMGHVAPAGEGAAPERIAVRDGRPTGHPVLDAALADIAATPRKPDELIEPLSRGLQDRLLAGLAERGVLRRERGRALGLFPMTRWPAADSAHETALRTRLAEVLLAGAAPDPRDAALLALAQDTRLVQQLVPKDRRAEAQARAGQVAATGWAGDATVQAIDAEVARIVAAVIVSAVIVPAVITPTILS